MFINKDSLFIIPFICKAVSSSLVYIKYSSKIAISPNTVTRNKNVILHEEPEDIKEEDTCILKVSVEDLQKDKDS